VVVAAEAGVGVAVGSGEEVVGVEEGLDEGAAEGEIVGAALGRVLGPGLAGEAAGSVGAAEGRGPSEPAAEEQATRAVLRVTVRRSWTEGFIEETPVRRRRGPDFRRGSSQRGRRDVTIGSRDLLDSGETVARIGRSRRATEPGSRRAAPAAGRDA
jgi:hypothetical protein